jgi:hypothetical protein
MVALSVKLIRNHGSVSPVSETHMLSFVVLSPSVSAAGPKSSRYWLLTSALRFNRRFWLSSRRCRLVVAGAAVEDDVDVALVDETVVVVDETVVHELHKTGQLFDKTAPKNGFIQPSTDKPPHSSTLSGSPLQTGVVVVTDVVVVVESRSQTVSSLHTRSDVGVGGNFSKYSSFNVSLAPSAPKIG